MAKNTTDWTANSTFESATLLSSTTVALNSTSVNLLGYAEGTHFLDQKNTTDYSGATKTTTDWTISP